MQRRCGVGGKRSIRYSGERRGEKKDAIPRGSVFPLQAASIRGQYRLPEGGFAVDDKQAEDQVDSVTRTATGIVHGVGGVSKNGMSAIASTGGALRLKRRMIVRPMTKVASNETVPGAQY